MSISYKSNNIALDLKTPGAQAVQTIKENLKSIQLRLEINQNYLQRIQEPQLIKAQQFSSNLDVFLQKLDKQLLRKRIEDDYFRIKDDRPRNAGSNQALLQSDITLNKQEQELSNKLSSIRNHKLKLQIALKDSINSLTGLELVYTNKLGKFKGKMNTPEINYRISGRKQTESYQNLNIIMLFICIILICVINYLCSG